jgi:hypothetical protein
VDSGGIAAVAEVPVGSPIGTTGVVTPGAGDAVVRGVDRRIADAGPARWDQSR